MLTENATDYRKLHWQYSHHHARFKRFVESLPRRLTCPLCGGAGGETEVIDPEIGGPWFPCTLCEGLGITSPKLWGVGMSILRDEKRTNSAPTPKHRVQAIWPEVKAHRGYGFYDRMWVIRTSGDYPRVSAVLSNHHRSARAAWAEAASNL